MRQPGGHFLDGPHLSGTTWPWLRSKVVIWKLSNEATFYGGFHFRLASASLEKWRLVRSGITKVLPAASPYSLFSQFLGNTGYRTGSLSVTRLAFRCVMVKTILIADDNAFVRQALRNMIESESDLAVCGEAENGRDAIPSFCFSSLTVAIVSEW
jgi:hypothetical protein